MPVAPTDELSLALTNLQSMVAASSSFQTWTGTANPTAALVRVLLGEAPDATVKPFAVVWLQEITADQIAEGAGSEFENGGTLWLQLVDVIAVTARADAYLTILNNVGAVRRDLLVAAGSGAPNLNIRTLVVKSVYRFNDPNAAAREEDVYIALLKVTYRP